MSAYSAAEFLRQVEALEKEATPNAVEKLIVLQQSSPDDQKRIVAKALARVGAKDLNLLTDLMTAKQDWLLPLFFAIGEVDTKEATAFLLNALRSDDELTASNATILLSIKFKDKKLPHELLELFAATDEIEEDELSYRLLHIIVASGDERKNPILLRYLRHPDPVLRARGVMNAGDSDDPQVFAALQQIYLSDPDSSFKQFAYQAMEKIQIRQGNIKPPGIDPETKARFYSYMEKLRNKIKPKG
jgi:HEAT repeat protein